MGRESNHRRHVSKQSVCGTAIPCLMALAYPALWPWYTLPYGLGIPCVIACGVQVSGRTSAASRVAGTHTYAFPAHVYTHAYTRACAHVYTPVYELLVYVHMSMARMFILHMSIGMCLHMFIHVSVRLFTYLCTCLFTCPCTCLYTYFNM